MEISFSALAISAIFLGIFAANYLVLRASQKTHRQYKSLQHDERIGFRRKAAATSFFTWGSTFAPFTWLILLISLVPLWLAMFFGRAAF